MATSYNEAINGDLSNTGAAPTLLGFSLGENIVRGTTGSTSGTTDRDYFTFTVPATLTLQSLVVNSITLGSGGGAGLAIQAGGQLTGTNVAAYLGYYVPKPIDQGTNILPVVGTYALNGPAIGFDSVLGPGTYTVWFQDTSPGTTTYDLSFNISLSDIPANTGTNASIGVNASTTGDIQNADDQDWYRISLVAGNRYIFGATALTLRDPTLQLLNSAGTPLAFSDDSGGTLNSRIEFNAATSGTYYLNVGGFGSATGEYSLTTRVDHVSDRRDFNGDSKTDVLWRSTNGDVGLWNSNAGSVTFTFQDLHVVDSTWQTQGTGDFNGDGKADILWRNNNGDVGLWNSNAGSVTFTFKDLGIVDFSWHFLGADDFNGDGKADILWRNNNGDVGLWNSNAGLETFTFKDLGIVDLGWQIRGTGDFNGDGKADLLWRNTNGDVGLWNSNAGSETFTFQDLGVVGSDWHIEQHT